MGGEAKAGGLDTKLDNRSATDGARGSARARLILLVLVVLLAPAALFRSAFSKTPFDGSNVPKLRAEAPDFVFIGDSMLESRLDEAVFERLTGRRAFVIAENGSASARWWLAFKNQVVAAGVRPQRVFLFFRDRQWSWPEYRTGSQYRESLEAAAQATEPELDQVLGRSRSGVRARVDAALDRVYPIRLGQAEALERLDERALHWTPGFRQAKSQTRKAIEASFDIKRLRKDVGTEMATDDGPQSRAFDPDPAESFLPHLADVARQHNLQLCLVRVKRRPNRPDNVRYDRADLEPYVTSLREWTLAQGIGFHDFTRDPVITLSMYADGDHIAAEARAEWTRHFVEVMGTSLR